MSYYLGVDLGTTYTSAAFSHNGRTEIITLADRSAVVPSVLFFREDGDVLAGDSAVRRGLADPTRVVREFKRRVGDPTPVMVGPTPFSADALMARLLERVLQIATERRGEEALGLAVTHPANWGPYKTDLLNQAIRMADTPPSMILTEPEAAAIHYAYTERLDAGEIVAVYDLGGGTFDASVLKKTDTEERFELLGEVEGIERLGGIDFDEAIFQHVVRWVGSSLAELDPDDQSTIQAVARLRQECVDAKEALSSDTDVTIPVFLPNIQTEVRLTRSEFEAMIRPPIAQTIDSLRRALRNASVDADDLAAVLLVGGSSRIPLIAQMVTAELGRPTAVDVHPKHTVALGAAIAAAAHGEARGAPPAAAAPVIPPVKTPEPAPEPVAAEPEPVVPEPVAFADPVPPVEPKAPTPEPTPAPEPAPRPAASAVAEPVSAADTPEQRPPEDRTRVMPTLPDPSLEPTGGGSDDGKAPPPPPMVTPSGTNTSRNVLIGVGGVVGLLVVLFVVFLIDAAGGEDTAGDTTVTSAAEEEETGSATETTEAGSTTTTEEATTTVAAETTTSGPEQRDPENLQVVEIPDDDPDGGLVVRAAPGSDAGQLDVLPGLTTFTTTGAVADVDGQEWFELEEPVEGGWINASFTQDVEPGPRITITDVTIDGGQYAVEYDTNFDPIVGGSADNVHIHFFWDTIPVEGAGSGPNAVTWILYDVPSPFTGYGVGDRPDGAEQMCATPADVNHALVNERIFHCFDLPDS